MYFTFSLNLVSTNLLKITTCQVSLNFCIFPKCLPYTLIIIITPNIYCLPFLLEAKLQQGEDSYSFFSPKYPQTPRTIRTYRSYSISILLNEYINVNHQFLFFIHFSHTFWIEHVLLYYLGEIITAFFFLFNTQQNWTYNKYNYHNQWQVNFLPLKWSKVILFKIRREGLPWQYSG